MRYEFGDTISSYVIEPGVVATGGRLAVLRGNAEVWFYDADTGGNRYTQLLDASLVPTNNIKTTNAAADLGYLPKFYGPDGVTFMWADANGGSGPRHRMEFNDDKLALAGAQTIIGDKTISGLIMSTNTHSWNMPINATKTAQISAITIRNDNDVNATDSPDLFVIWYKGDTDTRRAGWFNEWGGIRVRVPPSTLLGYADVAAKFFEPTTGGEDGLQVFGPSGAKKFYVRDGAISGDSLTLTGLATASTVPTLAGHLTNKAYVDSLIVGGAPDATAVSKGIVQLAGDLSGTAASPTVPGLATKANESQVVHNTGAEAIAGVKTFSASPIVPTPTAANEVATKAYADSVGGGTPPDATTGSKGIVQLAGDLDGTAAAPTVPALATKADDTLVVHNTGAENIAGVKTFSASPVVPTPSSGTQAANKSYVDAAVPDATTSNKGLMQLAGDLGGTATSPTVPALVSPQLGRMTSGIWYPLCGTGSSQSNNTFADGRTYAVPFDVIANKTLNGAAYVVVTTPGTGNIRGSIFKGPDLPTATLVVDMGQVAPTTTGTKPFTVSQAVTPGRYWIALSFQGTGTVPTLRSRNGITVGVGNPNDADINGALNAYYTDTGFGGAAPATFGAVAGIALGPHVAVKFA